MELKTIQTHHVPVRTYEGGNGQPLVFLHGAGGLTGEDPFPARAGRRNIMSTRRFSPAMATARNCGELRDMLDITLHTLDVVDALGLKDPILVGHSMGGMIAAEMAALDNHRFSRPRADRAGGTVVGRSSDPRYLLSGAVRISAAAVPRRRSRFGADDAGPRV
ncbi:MAG: alpha/beta fold hydrolase [Rhizomicrobium sp.]